MQAPKFTLVVITLLLVLTACAPATTPAPTAIPDTATPVPPTATATTPPPSATPTEEPTATPLPLPTSSPTPAELSIKDLFGRISPSVAYIDTPLGTGSGVLVQGGYLVTNAHVVWPLREVRVVFPDGAEFLDAPVVQWDLMLDLAVIGPLDTTLPPADIDVSQELEIASDVFLIGYPGEAEEFPTPTISRGLISRLRTWAPAGATYIQTDAAIAGGQSGGVLVSKQGKVIGISGFFFTESFALVLSAADVMARVEKMVAGEDASGLGDRIIPTEGGTDHYGYKLQNRWDTRAFGINEPLDTIVEIQTWSNNDLYLGLVSVLDYYPNFIDSGTADWETAEATIYAEGPYFAFVGQYDQEPDYMRIVSSHDMVEVDDPDDGSLISVGDTIAGNIDYPYDTDFFNLHLPKDAIVEINVDSIMVDAYLSVDYPAGTDYTLLSDDDSGGGFFDTNARLIFQAPHRGQFYIVIEDASGSSPGGYYLTVSEAAADATPAAPANTPVPTAAPVSSTFGLMKTHHSEEFPFSIQYPARWTESESQLGGAGIIYTDNAGGMLIIVEEDIMDAGLSRSTQEQYVKMIESVIESTAADAALISNERVKLETGLVCNILEFTVYAETYHSLRLVHLYDGRVGFNATYLVTEERYEELKPMIEYSFNTFTITE